MEWQSLIDCDDEITASLASAHEVCRASCCSKLQSQRRDGLFTLYAKLDAYRTQAIAVNNEKIANAALVRQMMVASFIHYLQLWLLVKEEEMNEAWDELIDAQSSLACCLRFVENDVLKHVQMEFLALERLLFPPQRFVSDSHRYDYAQCSICDGIYGQCEHIAGRLYMGRMCARGPNEITGVNHVAIVEEPADKGCRFMKVRSGRFMHCALTFRRLEKADDDHSNVEARILRPSPRALERRGGEPLDHRLC
jgi:hypothetical protein